MSVLAGMTADGVGSGLDISVFSSHCERLRYEELPPLCVLSPSL